MEKMLADSDFCQLTLANTTAKTTADTTATKSYVHQ